jgi:uncharacterized protein YdeI (YjbR/CyaY-like superfamily)
MAMREYEQVEIRSRAAWRAWLKKNHAQTESIWLVYFKKSEGKLHLPYAEIVEEALCFGWIDSLPRKLDEKRGMLLISPRKKGSPWSGLNKTRVQHLIERGLMTPMGMEKIQRAKADGSWNSYDKAQTLTEPADLTQALKQQGSPAAENWAAFSASSRRGILWWIESAKKPETRAERIAETARLAGHNIRANYPADRKKLQALASGE